MARPPPFGSDTLAIPVYLAQGDGANDPGLTRWKQEHPGWLAAGTWTRPARPTPRPPGTGRPTLPPAAEFDTASLLRFDPATSSVAEFQRIADQARDVRNPAEPSRASLPDQGPAPTPPPASDLAYPNNPPPGAIQDARGTTGYVFRLPNGQPIPDDTRTDRDHGSKRLSPTGFVMTPYSDSAPEVAAAGRRAGQALNRALRETTPDMPPSTTASQGAVDFTALTGMAVGQGGLYDYQREGSHFLGFKQHPQFQSISNFNVGLFCQQAGLTLEETLRFAGTFALKFSKNSDESRTYGLNADTERFIIEGHRAGERGSYGDRNSQR